MKAAVLLALLPAASAFVVPSAPRQARGRALKVSSIIIHRIRQPADREPAAWGTWRVIGRIEG